MDKCLPSYMIIKFPYSIDNSIIRISNYKIFFIENFLPNNFRTDNRSWTENQKKQRSSNRFMSPNNIRYTKTTMTSYPEMLSFFQGLDL